jgi:SAM-dependent methyltransferase
LKIKYRSLICPFITLIKMVRPGEKVGDVGCGSGQFLLLLLEFSKPSYVYGIEISKRLIDNAHNLFGTLNPETYDFKEYNGIDFPNELGKLDIIFLIDVLHHIPTNKQEDFIKELANTMKHGARLVLKDIDGGNPLVYFNKMHDLIFAGETGNEISIEKAKALLTNSGLILSKQTKQTMYVYPHYTIVAKK